MFGRHRPWGLPPSRLALPLPMAHYPGGAMGTSRPTAITHAHFRPRTTPCRFDRVPSPRAPPMFHAWCAHDPQKIFVLLYIPLKSSLCPFVLKIRTRKIRTTTGRAHYPGGAMVGGQASRLAPHRHATRAHCLSGLTACPWRLATASKTAATIGMIAAVRTETSVRCPYK